MKQISYPTRVVVPVDVDHGKMLDLLARREIRTRPAVFLAALRFYFGQGNNNSLVMACRSGRAGRGGTP